MFVPRLVQLELLRETERKFVSVLLGPRQVGKSYILRILAENLRSAGKNVSLFDLEDPSVLADWNRDDEHLIKLLRSAGDIVFIDEFQYLKNATKLFKALIDSGKGPKIFVSGSTSIEIHSHLKESLAGRYRATRIGPLAYHGEYEFVPGASFDMYLRFGGFPAFCMSPPILIRWHCSRTSSRPIS